MTIQNDLTIIYHVGAPYTDNDQLIWSLRKDTELLDQHGVMLRRPKLYRTQIADMVKKLDGAAATEQEQEALLFAIVKSIPINRLILSDSSFMGDPAAMLDNGVLFAAAGPAIAGVRALFPEVAGEIFLSLRNPALLIPEAFNAQNVGDYQGFVGDTDLLSLRWSEVIARIQQANPDCRVTVWYNEDTPVIWPNLLHEITAIEPPLRFVGELDIMRNIMTEEGAMRLETYLGSRPQFTEVQRRNVRNIFLEKFVMDGVIEEEIDLPGLTGQMVDEMSDAYEYDQGVIAGMAGVTVISSAD